MVVTLNQGVTDIKSEKYRLGNSYMEEKYMDIGIIGKGDGPTSIYVGKKAASSIGTIEASEVQNKIWEEKKEECRKNATPREKKVSGIELKNYLIDQYSAVEMEFPERQKQAFKASVLCNIHPEAFPESCFPPKEGGKRALKKWLKQNNPEPIILAEDIPDEKYGLQFSYLVLQEKEVRIYLELTTGHMQLSSTWYDSADLSREIVLWKGITKEDIDNETPEFMAYADAYSYNHQRS